MNPSNKSDLDQIMKDIPSSTIPLQKMVEIPPRPPIHPDSLNRENWGALANELLSDYDYGRSLALFGNNELSLNRFLRRLASAVCASITNEYQKRGESTETLKIHYSLIESAFDLLSKEVSRKELKDFNVLSLIASMHGFITNYTQKKETPNAN